tara:strand:- start:354 stop:593 length:240 start_codon:yes stop_codon:yes gene_type:complete
MIKLFSYVKYSEATFPMSSQYIFLLLFTIGIWILLWFGYRNNKINDENKEKEKKERIKAKVDRRKRLESLYPKNEKYNN